MVIQAIVVRARSKRGNNKKSMSDIFISYRREDSQDITDRISEYLHREFGENDIFIDVDNIPLGVDFRVHLDKEVAHCDFFIAVIGEKWLTVEDKQGQKRLDDPADFVRIEIQSALNRKISVIPVLVGQASMPEVDQLPETLQALAFRNATRVRSGSDFKNDINRLIRGIKKQQTQLDTAIKAKEEKALRERDNAAKEAEEKKRHALLEAKRKEDEKEKVSQQRIKTNDEALSKHSLGVKNVEVTEQVSSQSSKPTVSSKFYVISVFAAIIFSIVMVYLSSTGLSEKDKTGAQLENEVTREIEIQGEKPQATIVEAQNKPLSVIRDKLSDGSKGPKMVIIPAGSFVMGSPKSEAGRGIDEGPQHKVNIQSFALGKYEVTFDEYDKFVETINGKKPDDIGWGRGQRPVINVSWNDAKAYAKWLSDQTGKQYRLPTEAEWEYGARAGTTTRYNWGDNIDCSKARYDSHYGKCENQRSTDKVGSFPANPFGLFDVHGNVWEWNQDCYKNSSKGALNDGSARESASGIRCDYRVLRGGSWGNGPQGVRSANRDRSTYDYRSGIVGFRLARTL